MTDAVLRSTQGRIAILTVNNPPVNALAAGGARRHQGGVEAFGAGRQHRRHRADRRRPHLHRRRRHHEFGKPPKGASLNDVIATMENRPSPSSPPCTARALGGGLETGAGLPLSRRRADDARRPARSELGLLPGAGGTQRLPRVMGARRRSTMIVSRRPIPADEARSTASSTRSSRATCCAGAVALRRRSWWRENAPLTKVRDLDDKLEAAAATARSSTNVREANAAQTAASRRRGTSSSASRPPSSLPFDEGMKRERELFVELLDARASRRRSATIFFAEREAAKMPDVPADTPQRDDQDGRRHRRRHDGRRHRHELRQCRHPGDASSRSSRKRSTAASTTDPHELREHRQARRHDGRGRRQAHGADHSRRSTLRRPQGRRHRHRGGVRDAWT